MEHVVCGLAAVFGRIVYHVRRTLVHRQEAQFLGVAALDLITDEMIDIADYGSFHSFFVGP